MCSFGIRGLSGHTVRRDLLYVCTNWLLFLESILYCTWCVRTVPAAYCTSCVRTSCVKPALHCVTLRYSCVTRSFPTGGYGTDSSTIRQQASTSVNKKNIYIQYLSIVPSIGSIDHVLVQLREQINKLTDYKITNVKIVIVFPSRRHRPSIIIIIHQSYKQWWWKKLW